MQPRPFQQPQYPLYNRPPQPLLPHQRVGAWYRSKRPLTKIGIGCGCGMLVGILLLITLASYGSTLPHTAQQSPPVTLPSPTTTTGVLQATTAPTPTLIPTATPTQQPRPTVTPTQRPSATPTAIPAKPTPKPTSKPTGINGNPYGYDFRSGNLIYNPPSGFCGYFNCIPTFVEPDDPGDGYVVECSDGTYFQDCFGSLAHSSKSEGIQLLE